jgi:hypothetical protein
MAYPMPVVEYYSVSVWMKAEGTPHIYHNARNTYVKEGFFCVHFGQKVHKWPIGDIWRIEEEYPEDTLTTHKEIG